MGKELSFQLIVLAQLDIHMQKMNVVPTSHCIQELTQKWTNDLNEGAKTIKFLEENISAYPELGNGF